ncbi:MAG: substrate-binding domain-containing protein [Verrucomicrobia bacterium]|nr:substrate-binding domain-containing protein [Verrucomicrobiota bacterium]
MRASGLLSHKMPPTAIICGNDVIAIGALDAAKKHGIKVPEDLSSSPHA